MVVTLAALKIWCGVIIPLVCPVFLFHLLSVLSSFLSSSLKLKHLPHFRSSMPLSISFTPPSVGTKARHSYSYRSTTVYFQHTFGIHTPLGSSNMLKQVCSSLRLPTRCMISFPLFSHISLPSFLCVWHIVIPFPYLAKGEDNLDCQWYFNIDRR